MSDLVPYSPRALTTPRDPFPPRPPEGYADAPTVSLGLKDYIAIVRRQLWVVLAILAVVLGGTSYVVLRAAPQYKATSVIRLADSRRAMTGDANGEANPYSEVLGRETDVLLSQIQVMMSRQIAGDVVDKQGLRLVSKAGNPLPQITNIQVADSATADSVHVNFGATDVNMTAAGEHVTGTYGQPLEAGGVRLTVASRPAVAFTTLQVVSKSVATAALLDGFKAVPRPKTDIIDLEFVAGEPHYAQRIANAMAQTFQEHNTEGAQLTSKRRRIFLEEQMKQTDDMLKNAMAAYSNYRSGQQVFSSKEKATAEQQGIVNVDMRRADLDAQRRTFKSLLAQAQKGSSADGLRALVSSPGVAANPVIQQMYAQLTTYETARDSMITSGDAQTHPDVIAITGLIASTTNKLLGAVRSQVQALDAQIDALDNLKQRSTAEISSAPAAETEEARLAQQVDAVQKMADKLQEDYQKAKMSEAVEAGQVEIVDLAEVPTLPISAGRTRKLALGLIIGLLLGVGAAVVVDGMNTSIRRRDDLERVLNVAGLAVIPKFLPTNPARRLNGMIPGKSRNGNGKKPDRADGLVTVTDARSSSAEAYRTLRTNLIFSQAVQTLRTLVVTSPAPSEGKTTTAANLAVSFAQQGMRVLIVDCDLRRSRLHKMFAIPREPGFTELVLGQIEQDAAVRETPVPGLYVLASGQLPPNPAELLGGDRVKKVLASLGEAFDLIILDTPPLLAASDAAILGTQADGVLLVVRAGVTETEAAQQAMQQLASVGARVVGAVLNDPDSKLQQYGGYYNYEYASDF